MTNSQAHNDFIIAPSILSADFARLGEEVNSVLDAGAGFIHFDVMDNHFVPNLSFGPMICEALRNHGVTAPIDVHLMVEPVDNMVDSFAKAGASYISFHPEATRHPDRTLQLIKSHGCKAGVVLNPATPIESIKHLLPQIDMLLLMSVNPGFGGQKFIPYTIDKLKEARAYLDSIGSYARLEVDGGIKTSNIAEVAKAGADTFVAGSAIFGADNYKDVIRQMNTALAEI